MKIIWTKEALERLIEIEDYISKDSPERAARFVDKIVDHAELLSNNPQLGRMVPETANSIIRELIFKKYRIVYRLKKDTIEILTVFEGHMLLRKDEAGF
ncbi:MAG: type II toxin-antitoxin system RelE/ParE family toxin [Spirochaetota bacterium]